MAWAGTKTRMSVSGADLILNADRWDGSYEESSKDTGELCWQKLQAVCAWEQSPAGGSDEVCKVQFEINLSEDNAAWEGWRPFIPQEAYFRYVKWRLLCYGDPPTGYRPKITACELKTTQSSGTARLPNVIASQNNPPASPNFGDIYRVATGGGAWASHDGEVAVCAESSGPTWRYIRPRTGMKTYDEGEGDDIFYNGSAWKTTRFLCGRKPMGYGVEVNIANFIFQTVVSVTWVAGDYNHDKDEFFVKIEFFGGGNPPVAVPVPQVDVQIWDTGAAAWVTIWTLQPGQVNGLYLITINRSHTINTSIWATDSTVRVPTITAALAANLISLASGLRVIAMADTGAKCGAAIFVDRQK